MKETRLIMGMPITIELVGMVDETLFEAPFALFTEIDERFSTYKETSEITAINRGERAIENASPEMREVFLLAEKTKVETNGYFDMQKPDGSLDPSGIVKGWAIKRAAELLTAQGASNYCIDAAGDIATAGENDAGGAWSIGIRNPFNRDEIVKVVHPHGRGIATSGSYIRGAHIYDPHHPEHALEDVVSLTVIGPDVLGSDRFATAAFAMGREGISFIESLPGFEAYSIDKDGIATMTTGFTPYTYI